MDFTPQNPLKISNEENFQSQSNLPSLKKDPPINGSNDQYSKLPRKKLPLISKLTNKNFKHSPSPNGSPLEIGGNYYGKPNRPLKTRFPPLAKIGGNSKYHQYLQKDEPAFQTNTTATPIHSKAPGLIHSKNPQKAQRHYDPLLHNESSHDPNFSGLYIEEYFSSLYHNSQTKEENKNNHLKDEVGNENLNPRDFRLIKQNISKILAKNNISYENKKNENSRQKIQMIHTENRKKIKKLEYLLEKSKENPEILSEELLFLLNIKGMVNINEVLDKIVPKKKVIKKHLYKESLFTIKENQPTNENDEIIIIKEMNMGRDIFEKNRVSNEKKKMKKNEVLKQNIERKEKIDMNFEIIGNALKNLKRAIIEKEDKDSVKKMISLRKKTKSFCDLKEYFRQYKSYLMDGFRKSF